MTEAMARQITQLRMKGLGYKSIGIVVGTSRENVRYFSAYGNKFRKYCSLDCYVMDRFWKNGNLNHVVPKSKIRAGIKDIVVEA